MIPGRTYTVGDLPEILWRRKRLIALVFGVVSTGAVVASSLLPNRFRAEALILAAGRTISADYVRNTVSNETKAKDQLPSITQRILSRSNLERIIEDFDLYPALRRTKPMEVAVERMRDNIDVKTVEGAETFRVSYEAESAVIATQVTDRLAGLFIKENSGDRTLVARETSAFLESQLENARGRLVEQEKRLEAYRLEYGPQLPTQLQSNLQVIQNTQAQIQALGETINRDRDRRMLVARQLADLQSEQYLADTVTPAAGTPGTSSVAQLETAGAELRSVESRLKPRHPDVVRARQLVAELEARVQKEATAAASDVKPLTASEIAKRNKAKELQAEAESLDRQVATKRAEEAELRAGLDTYRQRVDAVPTRESELIAITRDYDTLQTLYRSLLAKKEDSKIAENLEQRQVIEQFKIVDPPHQPERPFSPNRPLIDLGGVLAGLVFAVGIAGLFEFLDKSVKSDVDLRATLDVPLMVMIPTMMSGADRRRSRRRLLESSLALVALFAVFATAAWLRFRF